MAIIDRTRCGRRSRAVPDAEQPSVCGIFTRSCLPTSLRGGRSAENRFLLDGSPSRARLGGVGVVLSNSVPDHMMEAEAALVLIDALTSGGVDACVGGGWAVDALLGMQTRPHGDLDLWLPALQFERAVAAFVHVDVDRLYPWGDERPWNFVLHDGARRRVDLHLYEVLSNGSLHYGGVDTGETFPSSALQGRGTVAGTAVRCESADWSLRWHTGYVPREVDHHDVSHLCAAFELEPPPDFW